MGRKIVLSNEFDCDHAQETVANNVYLHSRPVTNDRPFGLLKASPKGEGFHPSQIETLNSTAAFCAILKKITMLASMK